MTDRLGFSGDERIGFVLVSVAAEERAGLWVSNVLLLFRKIVRESNGSPDHAFLL